ncbi:MAG: CBS domain-containing protein [Candidatus Aminicenantes bacterium]|nr:CBS domain-containing protein [Candidatus Aminicenantes bacterium]
MFGRSVTLVRLFGFEVKIDFSWLILGLLITWTLAKGFFPRSSEGFATSTYWLMGVAGALGLLVSIVFHELWHSLVARRFGLPIKGITLFVFGGVAEMTDEPPHPRAEFFMAVAGPLSSIFLGLLLLAVGFLGAGGGWPRPVLGVVNYLGFLNLILAGFNLVPAFPLDGGRVLRAVLWGWKDNIRWATRIASQIGSAFGLILIVVGVIEFVIGNVIGGVWMFLIGMFLRGASQSAYKQLLIRRALEGESVRKFMKENPVTVSPAISLQEFVEDFLFKHHFKMFPVVQDEKLLGCVTVNQVKEVPREEWASRRVGDLALRCTDENTISPDEDAMKALAVMSRRNASRLMVVDRGKLVGVIALKDMMKLLSIKLDLEG